MPRKHARYNHNPVFFHKYLKYLQNHIFEQFLKHCDLDCKKQWQNYKTLTGGGFFIARRSWCHGGVSAEGTSLGCL